MHLLLTGATGLVGSGVLHSMLSNPAVTKVSILSRREVKQAEGHEKARVLIHKDFTSYSPETMAQLKDLDGVVWALGISAIGVSKPYALSPSPSLSTLFIRDKNKQTRK